MKEWGIVLLIAFFWRVCWDLIWEFVGEVKEWAWNTCFGGRWDIPAEIEWVEWFDNLRTRSSDFYWRGKRVNHLFFCWYCHKADLWEFVIVILELNLNLISSPQWILPISNAHSWILLPHFHSLSLFNTASNHYYLPISPLHWSLSSILSPSPSVRWTHSSKLAPP